MTLAKDIQTHVKAWLAEDIGSGDRTSQSVIPEDAHLSGALVARQDMTIAGLAIAHWVFHAVDNSITLETCVADGDTVKAGTALMTLSGPARSILTSERTALNILQHLSGIATLTRHYVEAIAGTGAILLDTRKTTPGLRALEKHATKMGGAQNHRMGLYDAVMIKDNHIAVAGGITAAVAAARAAGEANIQVECDTLEQVTEAITAGATSLLLDNMPPQTLKSAVALRTAGITMEASGGVTLDTIRRIAETGVDYVSVGRITQSAPAVDIGLDCKN